jgi:hypothetical protein
MSPPASLTFTKSRGFYGAETAPLVRCAERARAHPGAASRRWQQSDIAKEVGAAKEWMHRVACPCCVGSDRCYTLIN